MGELILLTVISIILLLIAVGIEVLPYLIVLYAIYVIVKLIVERKD